jgi:hypothetical protein
MLAAVAGCLGVSSASAQWNKTMCETDCGKKYPNKNLATPALRASCVAMCMMVRAAQDVKDKKAAEEKRAMDQYRAKVKAEESLGVLKATLDKVGTVKTCSAQCAAQYPNRNSAPAKACYAKCGQAMNPTAVSRGDVSNCQTQCYNRFPASDHIGQSSCLAKCPQLKPTEEGCRARCKSPDKPRRWSSRFDDCISDCMTGY